MRVKCFDVVSMVTEEATNQFSPAWRVNEENLDILRQYCEIIDTLSEEFEGQSLEADVDDVEMTVSVTLECCEVTVRHQTKAFHDLCELIKRAEAVVFYHGAEDYLKVKFTFPSIWDRA